MGVGQLLTKAERLVLGAGMSIAALSMEMLLKRKMLSKAQAAPTAAQLSPDKAKG